MYLICARLILSCMGSDERVMGQLGEKWGVDDQFKGDCEPGERVDGSDAHKGLMKNLPAERDIFTLRKTRKKKTPSNFWPIISAMSMSY
jgi:hypothetical protein